MDVLDCVLLWLVCTVKIISDVNGDGFLYMAGLCLFASAAI